MQGDGSVTRLLPGLMGGDPEAVHQVWNRFFECMVALAQRQICGRVGADADAEDVAVSAFHSACQAVRAGQFPRLSNRNDLRQVLLVILSRKALDYIKHAQRQRRKATRARSQLNEQIEDPKADPAFEVEMTDACRFLLDMLGDDELETIALLKLEGYTNEEITGKLNLTLRTVERRLTLIRRKWEETNT